jgi:hypothetical protein
VELEDQRKQMLEQIDDKRSQATTSADEYEEKTRAAKKILDQCRAGQIHLTLSSNSNFLFSSS